MNRDLKRCPFCGSSDVTLVAGARLSPRSVTCHGCGAVGPARIIGATAAALWNLRSVDAFMNPYGKETGV